MRGTMLVCNSEKDKKIAEMFYLQKGCQVEPYKSHRKSLRNAITVFPPLMREK